MDLTALDERRFSEHLPHGLAQRFGPIENDQ
jgi:hypothetical protein